MSPRRRSLRVGILLGIALALVLGYVQAQSVQIVKTGGGSVSIGTSTATTVTDTYILFANSGVVGGSANARIIAGVPTFGPTQATSVKAGTCTIGSLDICGGANGAQFTGGVTTGSGSFIGIGWNSPSILGVAAGTSSVPGRIGFTSSATSGTGAVDTTWTRGGAANMVLGGVPSATPVAQTLTIGEAGSGSNIVGGVGTIQCGGVGTGTAAKPTCLIQVPSANGGSASTAQTYATQLSISNSSIVAASGQTFVGGDFGAAAAGYFYWTGSTKLRASADGMLLMTPTSGTQGVTLDFATADTLKVKNYANNADAALTAGTIAASSTITSTATGAIGWSVVAGANTACNTTCTNACVFGEDTAVIGTIVACTDAAADLCVCAGSN